jgi:hypothetical protein
VQLQHLHTSFKGIGDETAGGGGPVTRRASYYGGGPEVVLSHVGRQGLRCNLLPQVLSPVRRSFVDRLRPLRFALAYVQRRAEAAVESGYRPMETCMRVPPSASVDQGTRALGYPGRYRPGLQSPSWGEHWS